jgi:hypothetical protein
MNAVNEESLLSESILVKSKSQETIVLKSYSMNDNTREVEANHPYDQSEDQ